ncbi:hypothetical protein JN11_03503 [Mucilaginibacter frigoritolerans]|uniref:TonB-like protein n=1 Tax=Mucilaginibacter frigoritolerans TaxID=652788 RepID=A0A562TXS6_9SPHI|nr:hypothetical protein [Mucilaginibacter frigoritolerans]TWI97680.1 hypothetical protein JN11_03503 [Mucilaginibacter frigoritolerans]
MKYIFILFYTVLTLPVFAQVQKVYITKNGSFSVNKKKAISYILIEKLSGDSSYLVNQYDMSDTILMHGTYMDSTLKIQDGKFVYYKKDRTGATEFEGQIDTNNYIKTVAYYKNGTPTGTTIEYEARNLKTAEYTYTEGGPRIKFKKYVYRGVDAGHRMEGEILNDTIVGKQYVYNNVDNVLLREEEYSNNVLINTFVHMRDAQASDDFWKYMEKKLKKYREQLSNDVPVLDFTVDKTGKIVDAKIVKGIKPDLDAAFITAVVSAGGWHPATYDNVAIEQHFVIKLIPFVYSTSISGFGNEKRGIRNFDVKFIYK